VKATDATETGRVPGTRERDQARCLGDQTLLGWREWVALPDLDLHGIKAKVDTGARTSALHAFYMERFREKRRDRVRFGIHPFQRRTDVERTCAADVLDVRWVMDSGGHRERRVVIETLVVIGSLSFDAELTLTSRDTMRFRMLLGRTAMRGRFVVDPSGSYLAGKPVRNERAGRLREKMPQ
jgi:hypothetical protein